MQTRFSLTSRAALSLVLVPLAVASACGSDGRSRFDDQTDVSGTFDDGGAFGDGAGKGPGKNVRDPATCEEAAHSRSYVGCDYWPTVTANTIQDAFDFAVAIANVGEASAEVTVTGPHGTNEQITVAGGSLGIVYLPWVAELKGGWLQSVSSSVVSRKGAYHLVSDRPVVVYQFNPLQFRAVGGKPGKDWSTCQRMNPMVSDCYSYSNDASLLLPTTAMTGTYRIMGSYGWSRSPIKEGTQEPDTSQAPLPGLPPYFVVTATTDGTRVTVSLGPNGKVVAGGGIAAAPGGGTVTFDLDAGDVAQVVGGTGRDFDFSGSLLTATHAVQVITGVPCIDFPLNVIACDHVEETVFPAETLGKHYVVMTPTGPRGNAVGHVVRLYGNADGTTLTYKPARPPSCPAELAAGEVRDCGEVSADFEVSGSHEFGVGTFLLGAARVDPGKTTQTQQGDPSQSFAVAVEQYRTRYVFLAPTDYKTSYVDVIAESGTTIELDGADVSGALSAVSGTAWLGGRLELSGSGDGVHVLSASKPVSIQVIGYGDYTTYQYPGGLNLGEIAPIPPK
jgi:hypothetical protein